MKKLLVSLTLLGTTAYSETFMGYPCTQDCSGHEAGYEWTQRKGIDDPDTCGGNSNSFIEGCRAAAEEAQDDVTNEETEQPEGRYY